MKGIAEYAQNSVDTQSQGRIVVLLYEGAVKFLQQAIAELEAQRFMEKGQYINKAVAIIEELNDCLDLEVGGEIARNLRHLYLFMVAQLKKANLQRDPQVLRDVITLLEQLNSGWKELQQ